MYFVKLLIVVISISGLSGCAVGHKSICQTGTEGTCDSI